MITTNHQADDGKDALILEYQGKHMMELDKEAQDLAKDPQLAMGLVSRNLAQAFSKCSAAPPLDIPALEDLYNALLGALLVTGYAMNELEAAKGEKQK